MKWLKIASENGNLKAEKYLEKHSKMTADEVEDATIKNIMFPKQPPKANPLDQELYGKAVREAASKGSKMAQNLIEIWNHMNFAMEAFKKKNYALLVQELSQAIFIDHQIVEVPEMFIPCIKEMIEVNPENIDAITCYVRINTTSNIMPVLLSKYLELHPKDAFLVEMIISCCIIRLNQKEFGLGFANCIIEGEPNSLRFLYCRAIALCLQDTQTPEIIKALDAFLALAPEDHNKVPACHYRKAEYFAAFEKNYLKFKESFEAGLEAEKKQLPCFLPYDFPQKHILERYRFCTHIPDCVHN
uniref:CCR4-NOT transcription complex subunit 11 n=1 Tax=Panagrolaimus superbus TaxID=310955 RepID=A0A914Y708_9BILA